MLNLYVKYGNVDKICSILREKYKETDCSANRMWGIIEDVIKVGLKKIMGVYHKMKKAGKNLPTFDIPNEVASYIIHDRLSNSFRSGLVKTLL